MCIRHSLTTSAAPVYRQWSHGRQLTIHAFFLRDMKHCHPDTVFEIRRPEWSSNPRYPPCKVFDHFNHCSRAPLSTYSQLYERKMCNIRLKKNHDDFSGTSTLTMITLVIIYRKCISST